MKNAICVLLLIVPIYAAKFSQDLSPLCKASTHLRTDDEVVNSLYANWMSELKGEFDAWQAEAVLFERDIFGREAHPDDAVQDFLDVFDLDNTDEAVTNLEIGSDDSFFSETVVGGRMSKEDAMVLHLRSQKRQQLDRDAAMHHVVIRRNAAIVNVELERSREKRTMATNGSWSRDFAFPFALDVIAFGCLLVVPWRMLLELAEVDPKRRTTLPRRATV